MTGRIFRAICLVATGVLIASFVLIMGVIYEYYSDVQQNRVETEALLAVRGYETEGIAFFEGISDEMDTRITLVDSVGNVLYDSEGNIFEMGNHLDREEIREALECGEGYAVRTSGTQLSRCLYVARMTERGTVLRLSTEYSSLAVLLMGLLNPVIVIVFAAVICAFVLALRLSKNIVEPLNKIDLDEPLKNDGYDELAPLLNKIDAQQRKIRMQKNELAKRKKEFATVTDKMSEGLILLGIDNSIISINRAAAILLGVTSDCEGEDLLSVCNLNSLGAIVGEAANGRRAENISSLSGREYKFSANPVYSDDEVTGIVLLMLDVTENVDAEKLRREFTANVSHELKTPLQTISGYAELIAGGMVKEDNLAEFAGQIYKEATRMTALVQDIISLSHLDEGAEDMQRTAVDLYAVALDAVRGHSAEAQNASVSLSVTGESITLVAIEQLISVIVNNLCDNAIKYNRVGGSVKIDVKRSGNFAVLSVSDTGIGIPEADKDRIFERFYRVDKSRSKKVGGTGLGLSIVKHAAKLHGATIAVDSHIDEGTTITLHFPIS